MSQDSRPRVRLIRGVPAMIVATLVGFAMLGGTLGSAQAAPAEFKYKTYKIPSAGSESRYIAVGPDGNLWFTEGNDFFTPNPDPDTGGTFHGNIGRITPAGNITEFRLDCDCTFDDIVSGPDNALYFTTNDFGTLGRITTAGETSFVSPGGTAEDPLDYILGGAIASHGNDLWGASSFPSDLLWRYNVVTGAFTEFPAVGLDPGDVAVDGDGIVWFTASSAVGRLDPSTGAITTTEVPDANLHSIAVATDDKVWFTDRFNATVGYVDPASGNFLERFPLTPGVHPTQIAAAADGSMWFTQEQVGNVARITADGTITEAGKALGDDPNSGLENAFGIAVLPDPDGPAGRERESVWFVLSAANKIASLQ
jgi:streptogramin lyase